MRVCLTVQGEQPISSAASSMHRGTPSGGAAARRGESKASGNGPCSRTIGPGWRGARGPPQLAGSTRKSARALRVRGPWVRVAEGWLSPVRDSENLVFMVISFLPPIWSGNRAGNPWGNCAGRLPVGLPGERWPKARKIRASASPLCAASVSADACLSLVCAIRTGTCCE